MRHLQRGVSLAAAPALPEAFPGRDVSILSAFIVIFATLVIQGLLLAPLIRLLRLRARKRTTVSELETRSHAFRAALTELEKIAETTSDDECEIMQRLLDEYRLRVRANENAHTSGAAHVERRTMPLRLELALVAKSREALLRLHDENRIQDTVLHRMENELDLEEFKLQRLLEP